MTIVKSIKKLFNEKAIRDGGRYMSNEHWPRVQQILSEIPLSDGNYLEIGPGNGYALKFMAENAFQSGHCYGLDISEEMIKCCRQQLADLNNVTLETGVFLDWAPDGNTLFDLIFSMEVFYYMDDMTANINRSVELLSPGGELIIMVDYFQENSEMLDIPKELKVPLVLWSKAGYYNGLSQAGLIDISQNLITGDNMEDGLTLCTRGKKRNYSA